MMSDLRPGSHRVEVAGEGRIDRRAAVPATLAYCVAAAFVALAAWPWPAAAAADDVRHLVRFDGRSFVPVAGDLGAGLAYLAERKAPGAGHLIVQLEEIPDEASRAALAERGLLLQGYLPERTWYALVSAGLTGEDLRGIGVRWMAPAGPEEKLSPRIREGAYAPWTEYEGGRRIFAVQFHDDVAETAARTDLALFGAEPGGWIRATRTLIAALDPASIGEVAALDAVKYVAQLPPVLTDVNDGIRQAIGVNTVHAAPYGLTGQGANILVYDGGLIDSGHPDFAGRLTLGEGGGVSTHGTHVGGTVGGSGANSGGTYKGMAPQTRITSYKYESCTPYCLYNSPQDIEANYQDGFFVHGANLATNSLGSNIAPNGYPCEWEGDYEITAQLLDAISHGSLGVPFLSVWAAGNERAYSRCGTTYATIGVPATAKNNIVVGATNSNDQSMTYFSSWGPVDDGRIRPDICAPGCQTGGDGGITSTFPGGGYGTYCGTSMATPATSGVIALMLQQWSQTIGLPLRPAPATVKALLVNTAADYGNAGPDYQFGYGEIRTVSLVDHLRGGFLVKERSMANGGEAVYRIEVAAGQPELRATLAWDDFPGELLAAIELVNDLDLTCESPSGTLHRPWILDPANPSAPAARGVDRLNPLEQTLVAAPEAGVWKLRVTGYQVPVGPQTYSLVANAPEAPSVDAPEAAVERTGERVAALESRPNPFGPRTTLSFRIEAPAVVRVQVFDASGRLVRTLLDGERRAAGTHHLTWDGRDDEGRELGGGVYFYQVAGDGENAGEKLLLVR